MTQAPAGSPMRCGLSTSLRATGSRECAPDDRLREAIHSFFVPRHGLLRFARNDGWMQFRVLAALIARGLLDNFPPASIRGRREDRVLAAPAVSRAICANKTAHEHTGQREHSGLPCAMALRLTSCSSRRTALLPPSPALLTARLTPPPRRPNHPSSPY